MLSAVKVKNETMWRELGVGKKGRETEGRKQGGREIQTDTGTQRKKEGGRRQRIESRAWHGGEGTACASKRQRALLCRGRVLGGQATSDICSSSPLPRPACIREVLKGIGSGHGVQILSLPSPGHGDVGNLTAVWVSVSWCQPYRLERGFWRAAWKAPSCLPCSQHGDLGSVPALGPCTQSAGDPDPTLSHRTALETLIGNLEPSGSHPDCPLGSPGEL